METYYISIQLPLGLTILAIATGLLGLVSLAAFCLRSKEDD